MVAVHNATAAESEAEALAARWLVSLFFGLCYENGRQTDDIYTVITQSNSKE